MYPQPLTHTLL